MIANIGHHVWSKCKTIQNKTSPEKYVEQVIFILQSGGYIIV